MKNDQKQQLYKLTDKSRRANEESVLEEYRSEIDRDLSRLKHSPSFRRLQGKTQLFPGLESDFFRNRLTHSIEVAQIAKTIAKLINSSAKWKKPKQFQIDPDVCELAGLAHDIGHPPFGHQGEEALNHCMRDCGGFEGNAQTLRILAKLEKKRKPDGLWGIIEGKDKRCGLNLTARSLAAILKYDKEIVYDQRALDERGEEKPIYKVKKGYYNHDADVVKWIKENVLTDPQTSEMKTVECQILDVADDIAYSVYDLEDALKGGLVNLIDLVFPSNDLYERVFEEVKDSASKYEELQHLLPNLTKESLITEVQAIFSPYIEDIGPQTDKYGYIGELLYTFNAVSKVSHERVKFTSIMIKYYLDNIVFELEDKAPELSLVYIDGPARLILEYFKKYNYISQIESSRLKLVAFRGMDIVKRLYKILRQDGNYKLMPPDFRKTYEDLTTQDDKRRVICDFIAGMTDRYAIEFYGRLTSEDPATIFKPF